MAHAIDVAHYLIRLAGKEKEPEFLTHMRLHKLLYYAQAWSLAVNGEPLFPSIIEAWKHGPVVRDVYSHFADYEARPIPPDDHTEPVQLDDDETAFVASIWESYKIHSANQLRAMTHSEDPWLLARGECDPDETCDTEITHDSMERFFSQKFREMEMHGLKREQLRKSERELERGIGMTLDELVGTLDR